MNLHSCSYPLIAAAESSEGISPLWALIGVVISGLLTAGGMLLLNYLRDRANVRQWNREQYISTMLIQVERAEKDEQEADQRAKDALEWAAAIKASSQERVDKAEAIAQDRRDAFDELRSSLHTERTAFRQEQVKWEQERLNWEIERQAAEVERVKEREELVLRIQLLEVRVDAYDALMKKCSISCSHELTCEIPKLVLVEGDTN